MPAPSFYRNIDKYGKAAFMAPSIGNKQVGPTESSFQELAKSRHDAIRNLSEKSTLEREAILAGKNNGLAWDSLTDQSKGEKLHEEHIITDGKKPVETKFCYPRRMPDCSTTGPGTPYYLHWASPRKLLAKRLTANAPLHQLLFMMLP
tara:strand:- start:555 stop:998 length:444 start_codon:yes stop_codon:yes gene_type:complete